MALVYTVKPLNIRHLRVLKNLSVIKRCPLLGGSLAKIVTSGTKHFFRYSRRVRYFGCPLLGGFTVQRTFNICVQFWFSRNRAATPLISPVITEAQSEGNAFKFVSSNLNLEIRLIRQLSIVFASVALVSEKCSRSVELINAVSAFSFLYCRIW